MSEETLTSYEEIPYDSKPLHPTHPDCLATLATLFGMRPAAVAECRVLELGCATGGNLIPMAQALPRSRFVGLDLSPGQIKTGQSVVADLGLTNIELQARSILDVDQGAGRFDYIICHGVYSWVPPAVQDHILTICRDNLAPQGIAYVSYNTYPGWHARGMVRELLGYHVRRFDQPQVRVQQARAFLDFLVAAVPDAEGTYARILKEEADTLRTAADSYFFHEHLEEANAPLYFHQFMERAAAKGLQYLGESWRHTRLDNLPTEVAEVLQQLSGDLIQLEQYLDFVRNRTFRRTLLCHEEIRLDRSPSLTILASLHATALAKPLQPDPALSTSVVEQFRLDDGTVASTNHPLIQAVLHTLFTSWPQALSFPALLTKVRALLLPTAAGDMVRGQAGEAGLAEVLLRGYLSNLLALHVHPASFTLEVSARPLASPLARHLARSGSRRLTNLRYRLVQVNDVDRTVLCHLDGKHDRAMLLRLPEVASEEVLSESLRRLADYALLIG